MNPDQFATTDTDASAKNACVVGARAHTASACPGLLRIVPALDGGICRIKLPCGQLSTAQARAIASTAAEYTNFGKSLSEKNNATLDKNHLLDKNDACIELTNRANVQIRALNQQNTTQIIEALLAAGLGPETAGADDIRNLMVSPCAGVDPDALLDVTPLAKEMLARLQQQPRFHTLSPKFAIQLDGGERIAMRQHPHDIWFSALPNTNGPLFTFGLAGCPPQNETNNSALAAITPSQVPLLMEALLHSFIDLAHSEHTRMRHLLGELPVVSLLQEVRKYLDFPLQDLSSLGLMQKGVTTLAWTRNSHSVAPLGILEQRSQEHVQVGVAPTLGRLTTAQLHGIADLVDTIEGASIRVTPWQSLLIRDIPRAMANVVLQQLNTLGLHTDSSKPITRLIACTGSTGCIKGLADTKADAQRLAAYFSDALPSSTTIPAVHLTGCKRSCAAAHAAPYTLLASENGRYRLLQAAPDSSGFGQRFGKELATDISIDTAGPLLAELIARNSTHD